MGWVGRGWNWNTRSKRAQTQRVAAKAERRKELQIGIRVSVPCVGAVLLAGHSCAIKYTKKTQCTVMDCHRWMVFNFRQSLRSQPPMHRLKNGLFAQPSTNNFAQV